MLRGGCRDDNNAVRVVPLPARGSVRWSWFRNSAYAPKRSGQRCIETRACGDTTGALMHHAAAWRSARTGEDLAVNLATGPRRSEEHRVGQGVSVGVNHGGRRLMTKKKQKSS